MSAPSTAVLIASASARVCASMDSTIWTVDTTDGTGTVSLAINPLDTGLVHLAVVGQNLMPYEADIRVVLQTGLEGERPMDADPGEKAIVENTREIYPGMYAAGMVCNAIYGAPRMGPIFGGTLYRPEGAFYLFLNLTGLVRGQDVRADNTVASATAP